MLGDFRELFTDSVTPGSAGVLGLILLSVLALTFDVSWFKSPARHLRMWMGRRFDWAGSNRNGAMCGGLVFIATGMGSVFCGVGIGQGVGAVCIGAGLLVALLGALLIACGLHAN